MIETITPASSELVTLAAAKGHLGLEGDGDDDAVEALIGRASAAVLSFIGHPLLVGTYRQTEALKPAHRTCGVPLVRWPVVEIQSVTLNGEALAEDTFTTDDTSFLHRRADGRVIPWPLGEIVVTYSAGNDEAPHDVQDAVLQLIAAAWAAQGQDPAMQSISIGSISLKYFGADQRPGIATVEHLLTPYREPRIG